MWDLPKGIFEHDPPHEPNGILELGIEVSGGKSIATSQYHYRALKLIRAHYLDDSGQVYYTIVNPGGGYVGGDAYRIKVDVATDASALITDQSAAKVYRTPNDFVVQNIEFNVDAGGVLEYIPDQLILYRGADFRQHLTANVHPEGSLFISDLVTPGWSPDGGQFLYKQAHLRSVVNVGGELDLVDNIRITPETETDFFMGGRTHFSTAICYDPQVDEEMILAVRDIIKQHEGGHADLIAAVTATDRPGFVLRGLANRTEELLTLTQAVANHVRGTTRGQRDLFMRKY